MKPQSGARRLSAYGNALAYSAVSRSRQDRLLDEKRDEVPVTEVLAARDAWGRAQVYVLMWLLS